MIVTIVSQCEKKAIYRTQRILDAFANRIGEKTWQTVITEEGLQSLQTQLRRTATKNTAVACHVFRSRKQSELLWIVGNRHKFNDQGFVPIGSTTRDIIHSDWENDWFYLPAIKALTAVAALFHDLGKASVAFQTKLLQNQKIADAYRHEWVSIVLLYQWLSHYESDRSWLEAFSSVENLKSFLKDIELDDFQVDFNRIPPVAQLICWLIVSHHRLPDLQNTDRLGLEIYQKASTMNDVLRHVSSEWGYANLWEDCNLDGCKVIQLSLLRTASCWQTMVKKWTAKLVSVLPLLEQAFHDGSWRVITFYCHLNLTLGDHYFSSLPAKAPISQCNLIANTTKEGELKQRLDEHLVGVTKQALRVARHLPRFSDQMEYAYDLRALAKRSPAKFQWQDKAVDAIKHHRREDTDAKDVGYFIVNMASTGKGKTIANAKIMMALSPDQKSLRYVLGLGLRTLTLQTGDSYRDDLQLTEDDLAVVIGSNVVQDLHDHKVSNYSESAESLLNNDLLYTASDQFEYLDVLFAKNESKYKAFLYKPVLCCTIDHMMSATECVRGGHFILPALRLMSSDLIIDEIDDFGPKDSLSVSRLVHLAGMMGRKVMISSATIPPDLAAGLFDAYQAGRKLYLLFKRKETQYVRCMWVDEFKSEIQNFAIDKNIQCYYQEAHKAFVKARSSMLMKQVSKHQAYLIDCESIKHEEESSDEDKQNQYYALIKAHIEKLHHQHHQLDTQTQKRVSFGVVRVANVKPCIELSRYLLNADWSDSEPKVLTYHSREILLLRSRKENYLDRVLKRKAVSGEETYGIYDGIVRQHLNNTDKKDVIFIVVATPVEEVGRDHDFDWAIVEPSSYRSIIQLAGRVLRHRNIDSDICEPNIGLLQYNIKGLLDKSVAFQRPGFEMRPSYVLKTKDLKSLIEWNRGTSKINAIPRITKNDQLQPTEKLADLEHEVIASILCNKTMFGAGSFNGWIRESWFMTALPQRVNPFRDKNTDIQLWGRPSDDTIEFCEKNDQGDLVARGDFYRVFFKGLTDREKNHLWIDLDYRTELKNISSDPNDVERGLDQLASRFGEILLINDPAKNVLCNIYIKNLGLLCGVEIDDSKN